LFLPFRALPRQTPTRRQRHLLDSPGLGLALVLGGKKSAIGRSHLRKVPKASLMLVECRHPGVGVCRIALQNFITAHEAMLHFVEAHQPAKLVCAFPLRITCVCGSNKLSTLPSTCVLPSHTRCLVWEITFSTKGRKCRNWAACFSTSRRLPTTFSRPDLQRCNTSLACRTTFRVKARSEEHTSELQSRFDLVCRLLLEKKKNTSELTNQIIE